MTARLSPVLAAAALAATTGGSLFAAHTNVIVLTGYWPPSNEMVRPFSTSAELNPEGWIGENWENRGFDVYSFFPTFANPDCTSCGRGMGDFEVDYQDTSADFWPIMNGLRPVAIITSSRTNANFSWELEMNAYNAASWSRDYVAPTQPTPAPPDGTVPAGYLRTSTLPMQDVVDAVNGAGLGLNSFICESQSAGLFLSGFMAYHGMWYQSIHADPGDDARCVAAGHIHVGDTIDWGTAREATKVTLRVVIEHVRSLVAAGPADVNADGTVDFADLLAVIGAWGPCPAPPIACPADVNGDGTVSFADILDLLADWS